VPGPPSIAVIFDRLGRRCENQGQPDRTTPKFQGRTRSQMIFHFILVITNRHSSSLSLRKSSSLCRNLLDSHRPNTSFPGLLSLSSSSDVQFVGRRLTRRQDVLAYPCRYAVILHATHSAIIRTFRAQWRRCRTADFSDLHLLMNHWSVQMS
jgi:hypothetical protein